VQAAGPALSALHAALVQSLRIAAIPAVTA